jgi:hypothetical protein
LSGQTWLRGQSDREGKRQLALKTMSPSTCSFPEPARSCRRDIEHDGFRDVRKVNPRRRGFLNENSRISSSQVVSIPLKDQLSIVNNIYSRV